MALGKSSVIRELVTAAMVIVLAAITTRAVQRSRGIEQELAAAQVAALRTEVRDRLIGTPVSVDSLLKSRGVLASKGDSGEFLLLWILDLERCRACFAAVEEWLRLEQSAEVVPALLLIGEPTPETTSYTRLMKRTSIDDLSRKMVFDVLGPILPSTKLLIDSNGTVVMADSRLSGKDCSWSFESQVARLISPSEAWAIRPAL